MKTTEFLGLNVPELADSPPDITKFSENYPKIDANAKLVSSQINNFAEGTTPVGNTNLFNGLGTDWFLQSNNPSLTSTDFNTLKQKSGIYQVVDGTNTNNNGVAYGQLIVTNSYGYIVQLLYDIVTQKHYSRRYNATDWTAWTQIATTEKIVLSSCLTNGFVVHEGGYVNRVGNTVTIEGTISGGTRAVGTVIAILPTGYRPTHLVYTLITGTDNSLTFSQNEIAIHPSGYILINASGLTGTYVTFNISFVI